jgi:hypothetical protein
MSSVITSKDLGTRPSRSEADEVLLDYRARRALEALEREAVKHQDCAAQCSTENSAETRIRAWEKLHQLRMPSGPRHPVLQAIATATQLSLDEVRHEQQLRAARRASARF